MIISTFPSSLKDVRSFESLWDGTYMMTVLAYTVSKLYWLSNPCKIIQKCLQFQIISFIE